MAMIAKVIGSITLPVPTKEQRVYLKGIIAADMTPAQIKQCTCRLGGPKLPDKKGCPIHNQ